MNFHPSPPKLNTDVRFTGAVYTPTDVVAALVKKVGPLVAKADVTILEPSVGDGAFLDEMRRCWPDHHYVLVDIDSSVIARIRQRDQREKYPRATLHAQDFLSYALPLMQEGTPRFDLIIGNPPFIRSHNFTEESKHSVGAVADWLGYPRYDLKNSWAAFLAASSQLASDRGVLAFILPYELITVAYGKAALKRLVDQFRRVDIYISREKAFKEIDQDAIAIIAQKSGAGAPGLFMNRVESLRDLSDGTNLALNLSAGADDALELNSYLLPTDSVLLLKDLRKRSSRLGDYAGSAPGIVSAANEFFILTRAAVEGLGFSHLAQPILKKGSYASHKPVFSKLDFQVIAEKEPSHILKIRGPRDEFSPELESYLVEGESKGYNLRYKCRKRSNWYEVPFVAKESLFFFKRSHSYPRLCINDADVYLTDTAYGLRLKEGCSVRGMCFSFYNTLTLLFAEADGRFYGGGVLEVSPTEFRGLPFLYHEPTDEEFAAFLEIHENAKGDPTPILDFGDKWLRPRLDLSLRQMRQLREAWSELRNHRMRHSGRRAIG